jgi:hypothetical protein
MASNSQLRFHPYSKQNKNLSTVAAARAQENEKAKKNNTASSVSLKLPRSKSTASLSSSRPTAASGKENTQSISNKRPKLNENSVEYQSYLESSIALKDRSNNAGEKPTKTVSFKSILASLDNESSKELNRMKVKNKANKTNKLNELETMSLKFFSGTTKSIKYFSKKFDEIAKSKQTQSNASKAYVGQHLFEIIGKLELFLYFV